MQLKQMASNNFVFQIHLFHSLSKGKKPIHLHELFNVWHGFGENNRRWWLCMVQIFDAINPSI
jgi:hypothetical protein